MYLYFYLYGLFSDRLIGLSGLTAIASMHPSALLWPSRELVLVGSYCAPRVTRNCHLDQIPKPEATLNTPFSVSIEINRGMGESSMIRYAQ
jgi:hypothetical protein